MGKSGDLVMPFAFAGILSGAGPGVFNERGALLTGQFDHVGNDVRSAVAVGDGGQIHALGLGRHRMHDHHVVHVIDPVVFGTAAVAHRTQGLKGGSTRLGTGHFAGKLPGVVITEQRVGGFDQMGGLGDLGLPILRFQRGQCGQSQQGHAYECDQQNYPDPLTDFYFAQYVHLLPLPGIVASNGLRTPRRILLFYRPPY